MRVVTLLGLQAVGLLSGTVLVESVFALPGLGGLAVNSSIQHDLPIVQGIVVYFTVIVVVINLVDRPRLHLAQSAGADAVTVAPIAADRLNGAAAASEAPRFLRRLLQRKLAVACLSYLGVVIGIAIVAPIVMPSVAGEHAGDLLAVRQGPTWHHLLGTDTLGRDVLDRLLVGTRVTMIGVTEALVVVLALGVPLGLAAGFFGGWIDRAVTWLADLAFSMPAIIIILVVLAVFPQSMTAGMVALGVLGRRV